MQAFPIPQCPFVWSCPDHDHFVAKGIDDRNWQFGFRRSVGFDE